MKVIRKHELGFSKSTKIGHSVADGISSFLVRRINSTHHSYQNEFGWDVIKKIWITFLKNGGNQLNKSKGSEQEVMNFNNKWKAIGQRKTRSLTERTQSNEQKTKTKCIIDQILHIHFTISLLHLPLRQESTWLLLLTRPFLPSTSRRLPEGNRRFWNVRNKLRINQRFKLIRFYCLHSDLLCLRQ